MKKISKRMLSLVLSLLMVVTMLPTFVLSSPDTAEAADVPSTDYWQIMGSTDFSKTEWSKVKDQYFDTTNYPKTEKQGNDLKWSAHDWQGNDPNIDADGFSSLWNASYGGNTNVTQEAFLYLTGYNGQTEKNIFDGVDNFKIDVKFKFTGDTGYGPNAATSRVSSFMSGDYTTMIKLAYDTDNRYGYGKQDSWKKTYFTQECWGRRHITGTDNIYATDVQEGGDVSISTTSNSKMSVGVTYHYVVYQADGLLGSYLTDDAGNIIINYTPIDVTSYSLSPSDITSIYLGNSGGCYLTNVAYKSIEIYKGVDTATTDSSKSKYLYTYFTGNSTNGESLHYALSEDGINFKPVNNGLPVWNSSANWNIPSYPTGGAQGTATSKHVRDPYILNKRNTSTGALTSGYYILATDLNTQNGSNWGNNSKLLVYDVNNLENIGTTTPWVIDTTEFAGSLTGGTVSRAWAPQAIWDPAVGKYMLYWSVGYVNGLTKIYYIYTSDFKTFDGSPEQLVFPTFCNSFIDADITYYKGLYYMWFKDEDAKKVYQTVAPHANGPYQGFEKFSDTGMEGPQVYELADGSYALMTDVYGEGNYYIYQAANPYDFSSSAASTTNINYLSPRHGSVVRITDSEYNAIISQFGTLTPNTVEYYWANDKDIVRYYPDNEENYKKSLFGKEVKDTAGHEYTVAWWHEGITTGSNILTLNNAGIYSADARMCEIVNGNAYTVDFDFKGTNSSQQTDNHTVFAIAKAGNGDTYNYSYVRISASGKFYVNDTEVSCTSAMASAVKDTAASHNYKVTFNGYATCLLVDGTYVGGVINTTTMESALWMTFGWGRGSINGTSFEGNRMSGEFGKVTISPTATPTGHDDDFVNDLCSTADVSTDSIKSFNGTAYHYANAATGGYTSGTVVYHATNNTDYSNEQDRAFMKLHYYAPKNLVLAYDGTKTLTYPIVFGQKCDGKHQQRIYNVALVAGTNQTIQQKWNGYSDISGSYSTTNSPWPGISGSYSLNYVNDSSTYYNCKNDYNTNTPRAFGNYVTYTGKVNNNNDGSVNTNANYYETLNSITFRYKGEYENWGWKTQTLDTTLTGYSVHIVNYKPIYDILKSSSPTTIDLDGAGSLPAKNIREVRDYIVNGDGKWLYTPASKAEALRRLAAVGDVNPNSYNYASDVSGNVSACATAIKNAYENYIGIPNILVKKDFSITYRMYDGTTYDAVVHAGNNINNKTSGDAIPDNSDPIHIAGTNTHRLNSWTSSTGVWDGTIAPSGTHVPHSNETYIETTSATATNCYSSGSATLTWEPHAKQGDVNSYKDATCAACAEYYKEWDEQDWSAYNDDVQEINDKRTNAYSDEKYTTTSVAQYNTYYNTFIDGILVEANDPTKSDDYIANKVSEIESEMATADTYLNPLAEYPLLLDKKSTRDTNNINDGKQVYTYDTWVAFASAYADGIDYYDDTTELEKADIGKYEFDSVTKVVDKTDKTTEQDTIEAKAGVTNTAYTALAPVDSAAAYSTYDSAVALVSGSIDTRKYTTPGQNYINGQLSTADGNVYKTLSAAEATAYNSYTDGSTYTEGMKLKRTTTGATDTYTGNVLSALNILNSSSNKDAYIKKYTVTFTIQDDETLNSLGTGKINGETATSKDIPYGDTATLTVDPMPENYSIAVWGTSNKSDDKSGTTGSQKVSGSVSGNSYEKVVSGHVDVVVGLSKNAITSSNYRYNICNAYGNVVQVYYNASNAYAIDNKDFKVNGTTVKTADEIPFYAFQNWTVTDKGDNVFEVRPLYMPAQTFNFTAVDGTITASQDYDKRVTYSYTGSDSFAAWAVKKGDKYQIASYDESGYFFACANENYVPVVKDGSVYKVKLGDANYATLHASDIDGAVATVGDEAANDALVYDKLTAQKPFISIENAKMTDGNKKARVYARATAGAKGSVGYGMLIYNGSTDTLTPENATLNRTVTSTLETGQFTYTLNNSKGFTKAVTYRAYIDYDATYHYNSETYTINARDYSVVAVATPNA